MSNIIVIIPARGGSKRVPRKNILPLAGMPLIAHSIKHAKRSKLPSEVLVSTDYYATSYDFAYVDTTLSGYPFYLPPSPDQFDKVTIKDIAGNLETNNLTVNPGSEKIRSLENPLILNVNYLEVRFTYINSTVGCSY